MVRIITVESEYGSGGGLIAAKVAHHLGWLLWDQFLTDEVARRLSSDARTAANHEESRDPSQDRLLKAFLLDSFEKSQNVPQLGMADAERLGGVVHQVIREVADAGRCVIVGRGAAMYLGGRRDAFHAFIYAPFEAKVRRLEAVGQSKQDAIELVANVDRDRADFIRSHFDHDWPARHRFHLMLNSTLGDELVVDTILDAAASLGAGNGC